MSLTRKEWEEMWEKTRLLESYIHVISSNRSKRYIKEYVQFMKDKIQSVIGQKE